MKVKGLFFDAGDTLFYVRGGVGEHYSRIAKRYGINLEPPLLSRRFQEVFRRHAPLVFPGARECDIHALERKWWNDIVQSVFDGVSLPEALFDEIYTFFEEEEAWSLFPETLEVLERLEGIGYQMGIISNFDSRIHPVCTSLGIRHFFKTVTISSRAGFAKPSPEIFCLALNEAGFHASEVVYVGDSLDHDVKGAALCGMTPLLLDRNGRYQGIETPTICDLRMIFSHL